MSGAWARFTTTADGDLAASSVGVDDRRSALRPGAWTWVRQVHGAAVVVSAAPGDGAGLEADAIVTPVPGVVLAVQVADCAPIALLGERAVGVVHAGWRGTASGVIGNAVAALRSLDAGPIRAVVGPCIEAGCYEFGSEDLDALARQLGEHVRSTTRDGHAALDLRAAVRHELARVGIDDVTVDDRCTVCDPDLWSHRGTGTTERQAVVAWLEDEDEG